MTYWLGGTPNERWNIAVNALDPGPIRTEAAELLQPPDHDWSGYAPPRVMGPPAVFLAVQDGRSFTGRVVAREDFRRTWPEASQG